MELASNPSHFKFCFFYFCEISYEFSKIKYNIVIKTIHPLKCIELVHRWFIDKGKYTSTLQEDNCKMLLETSSILGPPTLT